MSTSRSNEYDLPDDALRDLAQRLAVVGIEEMRADCVHRVLAQEVVADRDSPAADVSAMDGYAIRLSDLGHRGPIAVQGESAPGSPPPEIQEGAVVRIFTGAIVPAGCDAVVKREDTEETEGAIRFRDSARLIAIGEHIRRAGENAKSGGTVLTPGTQITAAHRATMANFGCLEVDVYSPVRVCIITTGDEVGTFGDERPNRGSYETAIESR